METMNISYVAITPVALFRDRRIVLVSRQGATGQCDVYYEPIFTYGLSYYRKRRRERESNRFTHSIGVNSHQSRGKEADEVCSAHLVLTLVVYHSARDSIQSHYIQQSSLVLSLNISQSLYIV